MRNWLYNHSQPAEGCQPLTTFMTYRGRHLRPAWRVKKGEGAFWAGRPRCPSAPGQDRQGPETLPASSAVPPEGTPHPLHPRPYWLRVAGKAATGTASRAEREPLPAPCPGSPAARVLASLGVTASSASLPLGECSGPGCRRRPGDRPGAAAAAAGTGEPLADARPRDPTQRCSADSRASLLTSSREFPGPRPPQAPPQRPPLGRLRPSAGRSPRRPRPNSLPCLSRGPAHSLPASPAVLPGSRPGRGL